MIKYHIIIEQYQLNIKVDKSYILINSNNK